MHVVLMRRRPRPGANHSVEIIFDGLARNLGPEFEVTTVVSRFPSSGLARRAYNVVEAAFRQGDVNHVTGDVLFLTYLLEPGKTVLTVLDCGVVAGTLDVRKRLIRLLWLTIPARRCAAITVISEFVRQDLLRHVDVDPHKVHVVPVAVASNYRAKPKPFNAQRPVILHVGTSENKNLPRLIEALAGLTCRLDIVGKLNGHQRGLLERHAVCYQNYVDLSNDEMVARYDECDVVAFASTFEGFGMPIVEANIVGRPVVTSNVTSMPEVAGKAACLVDPYDVASIRAGILRVIEDTPYREVLVREGFENAKRFDSKAIARQYEDIYRQVAASNRRS